MLFNALCVKCTLHYIINALGGRLLSKAPYILLNYTFVSTYNVKKVMYKNYRQLYVTGACDIIIINITCHSS